MTPSASQTLTLADALRQAIAHHQEGRLPEAERLYRAILQADPNQADANHNLGMLAGQAGHHAAGLPFLKTAWMSNPDQMQYALSYSKALLTEHQANEALAILYEASKQHINSPSLQELIAQARFAIAGILAGKFNAGQYLDLEKYARSLVDQYPDFGIAWKILGHCLQVQGKASLPELRKAVELLPDDAEAHNNLGNVLRDSGQFSEAATSCRRALAIHPDFAEAHCNLGSALKDMGLPDEAVRCYRRALQNKPDFAEAHFNLGTALKELGQAEAAIASYRSALNIHPDFAKAHNNLANALTDLGRPHEAMVHCRRAIGINPEYADAHNNLGIVLAKIGELAQAAESYRRALLIDPAFAEAHSNLGSALADVGKIDEAILSHRRALQINPEFAGAHTNLGIALALIGKTDEAILSHRRALEIDAGYAAAHNNLGSILKNIGRPDEAITSYRRAIEIDPDFADACSNLGTALADIGQPDDAIAYFRRALELKPDAAIVQSNLLFIQNYLSTQNATLLFNEARHFGSLATRQARACTCWPNQPDPSRTLRIGLVSADLRMHPVGYFVENMLSSLVAHTTSRYEIYVYSNHFIADAVTERIKANCHMWHNVVGLNDQYLAKKIHDDHIDILLDLSGHTAKNRLSMFAWKPAPVQASWLGYFATTGLSAIDYFITDPWMAPEPTQTQFTETILRLPETFLCFTPPDIDVPVTALPVLNRGHITFGCFNNLTKMNDHVVSVWARILHKIPGSRLMLKDKQFNSQSAQQRVIARFSRHDIAPERLILEGPSDRAGYLTTYQKIDIGLDPFPYPGGTTSVEALWMGVPILTLTGERYLSRQGESILQNVGMPDWIAKDEEQYIALAVSHASNLACLAKLRAQLRQQLLSSPLCDGPRFARHFEAVLRQMWTQWCDVQSK